MWVIVVCLQVIRTLDAKNNVSSGGEIQTLRNQLQEKERFIDHLEVRNLHSESSYFYYLENHSFQVYYL